MTWFIIALAAAGALLMGWGGWGMSHGGGSADERIGYVVPVFAGMALIAAAGVIAMIRAL